MLDYVLAYIVSSNMDFRRSEAHPPNAANETDEALVSLPP